MFSLRLILCLLCWFWTDVVSHFPNSCDRPTTGGVARLARPLARGQVGSPLVVAGAREPHVGLKKKELSRGIRQRWFEILRRAVIRRIGVGFDVYRVSCTDTGTGAAPAKTAVGR